MARAADVAAAALLDTLAAATAAVGAGQCHLSLDGDLDRAVRGPELREALTGWTVHPQRGGDFGARLAAAHAHVPGPVVQVGMDTPQLTPHLLLASAAGLDVHDAVLGPAEDGGWWVLALRDPAARRCFATCGCPPRPPAPTPGPPSPLRVSTLVRRRRCATSTRSRTPSGGPAGSGVAVRRGVGAGDRMSFGGAAAHGPGVVHGGLRRGAAGSAVRGGEARRHIGGAAGPPVAPGRRRRRSRAARALHRPHARPGLRPRTAHRGPGPARARGAGGRRGPGGRRPDPWRVAWSRCAATSSTGCRARAAGRPRCSPTATSASGVTRSPSCSVPAS